MHKKSKDGYVQPDTKTDKRNNTTTKVKKQVSIVKDHNKNN